MPSTFVVTAISFNRKHDGNLDEIKTFSSSFGASSPNHSSTG